MRYLLFCFAMFAGPGWVVGDEKPEPDDVESQVLQGLADLSLLRDSVLKRFTLMITGETHFISDARSNQHPLRIDRIYRLQAADKAKDFEYLASGRVMGPESSSVRTYDYQTWAEFYKCKTEIKGRLGIASPHGYVTLQNKQPVNKFMESQGLTSVRFDPFDDLVTHAMFVSNPEDQYGWIEQIFLQQGQILEANEVTQGDLVSKWRWKHYTLDFEIELTQAKAYDYLPVSVRYTSKDPKMPNLFGQTEIKWKKHAQLKKFLPYVIKAATGGPFSSAKQEHHHWVFDWRVGKEVPGDFFECGLSDFRTKFSPIYEVYFDEYGQAGGLLTGTPWKTPEELVDHE